MVTAGMTPRDAVRQLEARLTAAGCPDADYDAAELFFLDMQKEYAAPTPNWSNSLLLDCATEAEFDEIFAALVDQGSVMMGPEAVGDIRKCAWITDKFGITWQPIWK